MKPVKEGMDFFPLVGTLISHNRGWNVNCPHLWAVGVRVLASLFKHEDLLARPWHPRGPQAADSALRSSPQALLSLEERRASLSFPPWPTGAPLSSGLAASTEEWHSGPGPSLRQKPFWSWACLLWLTGPCPPPHCQLGRAAKFIPLELMVSTDLGHFPAQEVKRVWALDRLSLAAGQIADCPHTEEGRKMRRPLCLRPEAGRPADTCAWGVRGRESSAQNRQSLEPQPKLHTQPWLCLGLQIGLTWVWIPSSAIH